MSHWNWKFECCLIFGGLLAGGPLGTIFFKTLQGSLQPYPTYGSHPPHFFANSDGGLSSSTLSLLVPSSLWFIVTTSCVGCFFWLVGEVLRKLHSASTRTTTRRRRFSSDAAASPPDRNGMVQLGGNGMPVVEGQGGGADAGADAAREGQIGGELERARLEGELRGLGALLELDHNYHIHHFAGRALIFPVLVLPHGRHRLWGISFL